MSLLSLLFSLVAEKVPIGKVYDQVVDALPWPSARAHRAEEKAKRADELGHLSDAAGYYRAAASLRKPHSLARARVITELAELYLKMGDYAETGRWCEEASCLNEEFGCAKGQAQCARIRGDVQLSQSDYYGAEQSYTQALAACPAADRQGKARILRSQGQLELRRNHRVPALDLAQTAGRLYGEAGDLVGTIYALRDQAKVFQLDGRHPTAEKLLEQALQLSNNTTNAVVHADLQRSVAELRRQQGQRAEAIGACEAAAAQYQRCGHTIGVTNSWFLQGQILVEQQRWPEAAQKLRMVVPRYAKAGNSVYEAYARMLLGEALSSRGESSDAYAEWDKAAQVYRAVGDARGRANVQARVVNHLLQEREWIQAESSGRKLERDFVHLEDELGQARTIRCIGDALAGQGRDDHACSAYQRALEIFRRYQDVADELEVLGRLCDTLDRLGKPAEAQKMRERADELSRQSDDDVLVNQIENLRSSLK